MNLEARLNAIAGKKPAAPVRAAPVFTDCWRREIVRAEEEFPYARSLRRETLMLMQAEEMPDPLDPEGILYLDTETTGLSGGAGTVAFEVGLGRLRPDGFHITQLVMRDYPEERFLLEEVARAMEDAQAICTFNGKTFDLPLLHSRFVMNRMRRAVAEKPHIDLLHIARRVFKLRLGWCSLTRLETAVLGLSREDDLPGAEVPERYFRYQKTGEFALLEDVLRHNAQDIASLCVLLGRMAHLYEHPEAIGSSEDTYSMGVALERMRHPAEARRCYHLVRSGPLRPASRLRLAGSLRRSGETADAAEIWREMILRGEGGLAPYVELAKHYEHTVRDPRAALEITGRALAKASEPSLGSTEKAREARIALQTRYARLSRKVRRLDGSAENGPGRDS